MQVVIFKNIANERNPSMQLYAEELLKYMPANVKGFSIDAYRLPYLGHYLAKEFIYPKVVSGNDADVNHISDHSYCGLLRSLDPEKTVVTCHDLTPLLYPKTVSAPGRARYWFNIRFLPKAKKIITPSQFSKKTVIQFFGRDLEDKITVIPYGLRNIFKPLQQKDALRNKYNIKNKSILHVGNAYRHKNIDIILKFLKTHQEFQFVKVGPLLKTHKRYIRINSLQKQILRIPYIDLTQSRKLTEIYNCVAALIMPSFYEGFGRPILEAMACGCPVVCSDISVFHEIAHGAAAFFNPGKEEELESAISKISDNAGFRNDITETGLALAAKYSWKKCAEKAYKIYEEVYRQI